MSGAKERVNGTSKWATYASGFPWDLSDEQRVATEAFLQRIPDAIIQEVKFTCEEPLDLACRFLRARKFSVDDAERMILDTKAWRDEFGAAALRDANPDDLLGCPEAEVLQFWPHRRLFGHYDKAGRPVYCELTGGINVSKLLKVTTSDKLLKWHVHSTEKEGQRLYQDATDAIREGRSSAPEGVTCMASGCVILDMTGFSMGMVMGETKAYLNKVTGISQNYYPETMGKMFIINAPLIFTTVWALVKGWLDARTVSKIEILGGPSEYEPRLLAEIGAASVPQQYGGTLDIGELYPSVLHKIKLEPKATDKVEVPIKAGETLRARWWADGQAVEFSVAWHAGAVSGDGEVVTPAATPSDCVDTVADCTHVAPADGVYVLKWTNANKAGWVSSGARTVTYGTYVSGGEASAPAGEGAAAAAAAAPSS